MGNIKPIELLKRLEIVIPVTFGISGTVPYYRPSVVYHYVVHVRHIWSLQMNIVMALLRCVYHSFERPETTGSGSEETDYF